MFFIVTLNLKNPHNIEFFYYFDIHWQAPAVVILSVAFLVGLVLGWLLMIFSLVKSKSSAGMAKRKLAKFEKKIQQLELDPDTKTDA